MIFRKSVYEPVKHRVGSAAGSGVKTSFKMKVDNDGRRSLIKDGKIDLYAQIQSHKDSCDIAYLMTRFSNGDASALSQAQGLYGDFTNIPTNLNELKARVMDAERLFYQLPADIREQFEHNPSRFYSLIGTDAFNQIMGVDKSVDNPIVDTPAPISTPVSEVKNV